MNLIIKIVVFYRPNNSSSEDSRYISHVEDEKVFRAVHKQQDSIKLCELAAAEHR